MTKIAVLTPVSKGGPFIWGRNLVDELQKKGFEAEHICTLSKLFKTMFYTDADLVHTTVPLCFRLWSKPVVLTVKGDFRREKRIWRIFYPLSIKLASAITCSTKFLKHKLSLKTNIIIPNAVNLKKFSVWAKHGFRKRVSIVTMTKFRFEDKAEGITSILALLLLIKSKIPFKWTIIGGGEYFNDYKQFVLDKVDGEFPVYFKGFIEHPEFELPKHDIFLYYSEHDSFATAVIEAMACGLPVVTNDYGPTREIIKDGVQGFICDNVDYLNNVERLLCNWRLRKKMGIAARKKVYKKFSWNDVVNQYIHLYKSFLGMTDEK